MLICYNEKQSMTDIKQDSNINKNAFLLYQTEDGQTRIDVRMHDETVWLSLNQMAELFQRDKSVISKHIKNIFTEGELLAEAVVANFATTATDGKSYQVDYYNLDVIISVGYRVKSHRGTQFRIWATQRLREYLIKGFALDDERLKQIGGGKYFDELLARIRDIHSSEKVFWRKVLDIYSTSIDYDPNTEISREFFATVQNKMHWAAHGHTAAEIVNARADYSQPNMGLTSWTGTKVHRQDVEIAKNYLNEKELNILNRIVSFYLEFAELQALEQKPMYMQDWIVKLDDFLKTSGRDILNHSGNVSRKQALEKARAEYEKYWCNHLNDESPIEKHFAEAIDKLGYIEKSKGAKNETKN
jgi:hypothetical protein